MKIKYVIEADAQGYKEEVWIDGELKNTIQHHATHGGTKMAKSSKEHIEVFGMDFPDVVECLDTFQGFDLFLVCNRAED